MTAGIIAILAALIPFVVWLWKRNAAKHDDPEQQNIKRREEIGREIAQDDERRANLSLADDLDRLHALQGDQRRQDGPPAQGPG